MATFEDLFESDDEEEFLGFTRSDVEEEEDASGESDVSVDEGTTTRPNCKEFPLPLKQAKLRQGESITLQKNGVTACSWQDKRK
ncbi:hypothetical protein QZH41_019329, partial [Actinostola sp. cb2023]